jgi:quinol monooxygenase YgiN
VVVMTGRIEASPGARRELAQALLEWAAAARAVDGVDAHLYEDLECAHIFCFVSHWPDAETVERHVCGQQFAGLVGAIELLAVDSSVDFGACEIGRSAAREFRRRARIESPSARPRLDS